MPEPRQHVAPVSVQALLLLLQLALQASPESPVQLIRAISLDVVAIPALYVCRTCAEGAELGFTFVAFLTSPGVVDPS